MVMSDVTTEPEGSLARAQSGVARNSTVIADTKHWDRHLSTLYSLTKSQLIKSQCQNHELKAFMTGNWGGGWGV